MVIRRTTPEDAASVSALIQCTVFETNTADYSAEIIKLICTNFTIERVVQRMAVREVFVGTIETVIVGTISFGEGRLHSMFVDPNLQRQGIGSRLVKHLEMHAVAKGVSVLRLHSSITARAFYERMGYAMHEFEKRDDGSTFLMSKNIAG